MEQGYIDERIKTLKGKIGLYYENMVNGEKLAHNAGETFLAASVIKVPIFMCVCKMASEGRLNMSSKIVVRDEDKKPSCGALLSMTGDIQTDLGSLCRLMITLSDNTATNMVIRAAGIENLRREFAEIGLRKTCINRELFDSKAAAAGLENFICPEEIAMLLKKIYNREFVSREVSEEIEKVMLLQQIRHKIPGYIGRKKKIANKTGEDGNTTHDVAIVYSQNPFVLVITADDTDVAETEKFMRETALEIYRENGEGE